MENRNHVLKRVFACVMVVIMTLTAVPLSDFVGLELPKLFETTASAYYTEGYLEYDVENGEAMITGHTSSISGDLVIPDTLGGYPVTSIGEDAFYRCTGLTSVTIGNSVTSIGDKAFYLCRNLTSVNIPYGVTSIGEYAFYDCTGLTSVTIPDSVTSIDDYTFFSCHYLTSITIPDSVTSIGDSAFFYCSTLKNVIIPDSVTRIGREAFRACHDLTSVTIGNGVETISSEAFKDCSLTTIKIGKNVKTIGIDAFNGIKEIPEVYYAGSEAEWKNISIDQSNDMILRANMHYNAHTHSYTSKVTKAATCTQKGIMTYTCTCGDSYTKAIPATGKHTNKTTTTAATASKDGKTVTACTACGNVASTVVIPKVSSFKLSATSYTYNGKAQTPTVTVKDSKGKTLKKNTDYTVKYASGRKNTGKYAVTVTLKGNYSGSKTLYFNILPGKTSKLTATQTTSSVKATWKAVTGASGYKVILYSAKNKALKTVDTTKTTYTFTKLSKGTTYKVKVTAYKTIDGKKVLSGVNTILTTTTKPAAPTLSVTAGAKKATLKWNKQTGATGYIVYMATSKSGKFSKIATLKGNSKISYTKTGLTKDKTYYFKVCAYTTAGGKNINGTFSAVKSVKVK